MDKIYRILVINPGSTSTKLSMFENETCLFTEDVFHDSSVLKKFPTSWTTEWKWLTSF